MRTLITAFIIFVIACLTLGGCGLEEKFDSAAGSIDELRDNSRDIKAEVDSLNNKVTVEDGDLCVAGVCFELPDSSGAKSDKAERKPRSEENGDLFAKSLPSGSWVQITFPVYGWVTVLRRDGTHATAYLDPSGPPGSKLLNFPCVDTVYFRAEEGDLISPVAHPSPPDSGQEFIYHIGISGKYVLHSKIYGWGHKLSIYDEGEMKFDLWQVMYVSEDELF